jgi:hypothetical protein
MINDLVNKSKEVTSLPKTKQEVHEYFVSELAKLLAMLEKVERRERSSRANQFKK